VISTDGRGTRDNPLTVGDFVNVRIEAVNLRDLQEVALVLRYNPAVLQVLGGSLGVERGILLLAREPGDPPSDPASIRRLGWAKPEVEPERGIVRIAGNMGEAGPVARATGTIATIRFR